MRCYKTCVELGHGGASLLRLEVVVVGVAARGVAAGVALVALAVVLALAALLALLGLVPLVRLALALALAVAVPAAALLFILVVSLHHFVEVGRASWLLIACLQEETGTLSNI